MCVQVCEHLWVLYAEIQNCVKKNKPGLKAEDAFATNSTVWERKTGGERIHTDEGNLTMMER